MKITDIEKKGDIYFMTKSPEWFEILLGVKEKVERYRHCDETFRYFDHLTVFYKSTGEMMHHDAPETIALNNYMKAF
jgi:hypothetical protein